MDGENRYKIQDVLGFEEGLGVENLRGSGQIAGETSLAYEQIVTMTLVTCRSVNDKLFTVLYYIPYIFCNYIVILLLLTTFF